METKVKIAFARGILEVHSKEGSQPMLVKVDAKALEWRVAVELSGDKVGLQEILDGVDNHADNQKRFGLPSRLIAKTYLFRLK